MRACVYDRKMNRIILTILLSVLMVPIAVLFYFYSAIFGRINYAVKMRVVRTLETKDEINSDINEKEKETSLDELKIAFKFSKGLFVMYLMYLFTIFPLCFTMIVDIDQEWPAYIHLYPWLFFRLCSAATPVVYPFFHSSIRDGYKEAIDRYVLRKKKLLIKPKRKPLQIRSIIAD